MCRLLPRSHGLPRFPGGSASASSLSRPPQASRALRPAGLLNRPRRPLSRGFDQAGCPARPLVSYQINRQLSGWNLPPLVIRAVGAHVESRTGAVAWAMRQRSVSRPRSSNRTCGLPASGFPTGFSPRHTAGTEFGVCCRSSGRWQTRPAAPIGVHLRRRLKPLQKRPDAQGCSRLIANHRSSAPSKAHQKQGPFPPPALPGLHGRTALSDSRPTRRLCGVGVSSPSRDGSPPLTRITLPTCRAPYPGGSRRVHVSIASPLTRPSPFPRRVGIRIFTFEMLWGGRWRDVTIVAGSNAMERPMAQQLDDLSRSLTPLEQDSTIIAVIEMSQASWLVAGIVPGIERHLLKKLEPSEVDLLRLLMRWRAEATQNGRTITRIVVAFEAGRDGFWLARWLRARDIEASVIHATSVAVSREHRRAKTDRLDTGLLKRVFIGWLRGEPDHCHMVAIPTLAEEDAKRPNREREALVRERTRLVNRMKSCLIRFGVRTFKPTLRNAPDRLATLRTPEGVPLPPNTLLELRRDMARLRFVMDQIKEVEEARAQGLEQAPEEKTHVMVRLLARVMGIGIETADMLVHEVLARTWRDRRAVARYAGLTGSPDESGSRRREKGLAKAGNARVRRGMIQLAWRFLLFQKESALAQWYRARTADPRGGTRKTLIVALARKLLIALWRMVTTGEVPAGVVVRAA